MKPESGAIFYVEHQVFLFAVDMCGCVVGVPPTAALGPDPRPARMNPDNRLVSVGAVTTNGAFRLALAGTAMELTPLPLSPAFTTRIRWRELPWKLDEPTEADGLDEEGRVLRRVPVEKAGGEIRLTSEPDAFTYRFR